MESSEQKTQQMLAVATWWQSGDLNLDLSSTKAGSLLVP